jgi:CHASE domain
VDRSEFNTSPAASTSGTVTEAPGDPLAHPGDRRPGGGVDLPPARRPVAYELFVPVYRTELPYDASVATRRRVFLGWAAGQFRAGDFLEAALAALPGPQTTGVELHDGEVPGGGLIASYPPGFRAGGPYLRERRSLTGSGPSPCAWPLSPATRS